MKAIDIQIKVNDLFLINGLLEREIISLEKTLEGDIKLNDNDTFADKILKERIISIIDLKEIIEENIDNLHY